MLVIFINAHAMIVTAMILMIMVKIKIKIITREEDDLNYDLIEISVTSN